MYTLDDSILFCSLSPFFHARENILAVTTVHFCELWVDCIATNTALTHCMHALTHILRVIKVDMHSTKQESHSKVRQSLRLPKNTTSGQVASRVGAVAERKTTEGRRGDCILGGAPLVEANVRQVKHQGHPHTMS